MYSGSPERKSHVKGSNAKASDADKPRFSPKKASRKSKSPRSKTGQFIQELQEHTTNVLATGVNRLYWKKKEECDINNEDLRQIQLERRILKGEGANAYHKLNEMINKKRSVLV